MSLVLALDYKIRRRHYCVVSSTKPMEARHVYIFFIPKRAQKVDTFHDIIAE